MRKLFLLMFCWPFLTQAQVNQDSIIIKKMSDEIMTNGKAYDLLRQLTKQIGGRLAGSPQQQNAAIWGKRNMESFAPDKVFMQPCKTPNWQRGGKDFASVVSVNGKGNAEVKGKIVYYHSMFDPTIVQTFGAYGKAGVYRSTGASRAAMYGAVGVMLHSLSSAPDNAPHTGGMKYDEAYPKIPAVALGPNDAKELYANAKKGTIRVQMQTYGYFLPDADENNVVAEIKGSTFPNEIITIGGHLDSWDVNEGAHDDGAGIVQTMEILRTMKALNYQPKRTIRFVLFANEENGMRGGNKYAELAKQNNEQHVFALESDAGGFTPRAIGISATSPEQFKKMQQWASLLKPYGTEITAGGGGADIGPLKNVNASIVLAGLVPDSQRYFDLHHAKTDVFENVNKRELLLGAVNMAAIIYLVDQYGVPK